MDNEIKETINQIDIKTKDISELKFYKKNIIGYTVLFLVLCFIYTFPFVIYGLNNDLLLLFILPYLLFGIGFMPFVIYYLFRFFYVKKNVAKGKFNFYEAVLENPESSFLIRINNYYSFFIKDNKKNLMVRTRSMFSSFPLFALDIDNYNNKKVIVGYNKEKDDLIVIKKCENV